ncbi:VOC family protein [Arthrobacter sp. 9MFCol3.1]|uniref:VOC family protein n=1 Tax=Arthrobacter sp. 9MFCol3.1 TaxID=1150398 RepID=UPI0012DF0D4D|nr:hypothetical protein [Arthrobacter sp. 9MFCol3.1]
MRVDDVGEALVRAERAGGKRLAPFDARADDRLAVLVDATGVPFCLRKAGGNDGAELANEANSWAMSSLRGGTFAVSAAAG